MQEGHTTTGQAIRLLKICSPPTTDNSAANYRKQERAGNKGTYPICGLYISLQMGGGRRPGNKFNSVVWGIVSLSLSFDPYYNVIEIPTCGGGKEGKEIKFHRTFD